MFQTLIAVTGAISAFICIAIVAALLWQSPLVVGSTLFVLVWLIKKNYDRKRKPNSLEEDKP